MSAPRDDAFLDEAARLGHRLAGGALRHGGRATWLADGYDAAEGVWRRRAGTLPGDLGSGTAGVGLFLAQLAAATGGGEPRVRDTAVEALRHSLTHGDALLGASRLGWYDGALGVAGAATLGGRRLGRDDLVADAARLTARAAEAAAAGSSDPAPRLLDGAAGVMAGLLWAGADAGAAHASEAVARATTVVGHALSTSATGGTDGASPPVAGLAIGRSGVGLVLAAWARRGEPRGEPRAAHAAAAALDDERRWFEPGAGWWCPLAHPWLDWDPQARTGSHRAWCAGAAGIGVARLVAYAASREPRFLAEAGAALALVREGMGDGGDDASVCHGWAGEIELLVLAASLLGEPAHLHAARAAARVYVARARERCGYGSGLWEGARTAALLHGLAGVGLTLLRLHDPRSAPSPALPPGLAHG